jgi:hypothetical protein
VSNGDVVCEPLAACHRAFEEQGLLCGTVMEHVLESIKMCTVEDSKSEQSMLPDIKYYSNLGSSSYNDLGEAPQPGAEADKDKDEDNNNKDSVSSPGQ